MSAHWAPGATQDFAFLVILGKKMPGTVCACNEGSISSQVPAFPLLSLPPPHTHTEKVSVLTGANSKLWMDHVFQNGTGALGEERENDYTGEGSLSSTKKILERG